MSADSRGKAAPDVERAGDLTPGEYLRAEIERLGLDQVAVSKATGVSRQSINNIINGRQPVSRAMAGKLGRLTGHSSDYWLRESFSVAARALRGTPRSKADVARFLHAGILVKHQIERAVKVGIIGIAPFAAENVKAASMVLVLDNVVTTPNGEKIDLSLRKNFVLKTGHLVNVSTKERIGLPRDFVGRLGALDRLVGAGIVTSHALQVEPGFDGHLHFCLYNAGARQFRLDAGDPVIGLEIIRLTVEPD